MTQIVGVGHYQPQRVLTNDELAARVDTTDQWIQDRVGIATRHIADLETVLDMAIGAAQHALANSGLTGSDIDLVVVGTASPLDRVPSVAAGVAAAIGADTPAAYDLNAACAGFCYALATADHAIRADAAQHALVIGVDKLSDFTDWTDRTTCVIFGDAAGAAVVSGSSKSGSPDPGIGPVVWGSDTRHIDAIRVTADDPHIRQIGQTVFRWTTTALSPLVAETCARAGVKPKDLAAFVPHQANLRIVEALARKLGAPQAIIARDIVESGNTSAASIPLALSKLVERGEIPAGAPVLLFGFGGGLTYAGQVVRCPQNRTMKGTHDDP